MHRIGRYSTKHHTHPAHPSRATETDINATQPEGVSPDASQERPPPHVPWQWRRRGILLTLATLLLVVPLVVGLVVHFPYYVMSPGEARGVADLIKVKGDVKVYPPDGRILFTTVSLVGGVNVYQALGGWLNREVKLVPAREITGGAPPGKVREQNIQAMVDSKFTATKVALDRLGYRVSVTGDGALVAMVKPGDPADGKLRTGDVITSVDGETVTRHDEVVSKVRQHHPGDMLQIGFRRNGADQTTILTAADAGNRQALIGVELQTNNAKYKFPFEVSIDTGLIGGPSAGLAFTLALIDDLAGGELTGGRDVAVTGTIDDNGNVGEVGGVAQKAITAKRAGAVAFLVPPAEEKEAREFAGEMRIIPVRSLNDALNALHQLGGTEVAQPATPPTSTSPHS